MEMSALLALLVLGLSSVLAEPSETYQGTALGPEQRCQSMCLTVCDTPECVAVCGQKFCTSEDSAEATWLYVGVMGGVVVVLIVVLRLVLRKMVMPQPTHPSEETSRYYHSL